MFKNYNMNQLVLPLDLAVQLEENDIAFAIHHLVENIPERAFDSFQRQTGCPSYHPRILSDNYLYGKWIFMYGNCKNGRLNKNSKILKKDKFFNILLMFPL